MTWMELKLLLDSMAAANHTSLCDTPAQRVSAIVDGECYYFDLHESMTSGKLYFVQSFTGNSGDDEEDDDAS